MPSILKTEKFTVMKKRVKSTLRSYLEVVIISLIIGLALRTFVVQAYKIPTHSMENALLAGDFVLVNKFIYNFTTPQPGDVVVFKYPLNPSKDFIKRCVAIEGQTVQIIDKALYVDGKEIHDDIEFARTDKVNSVERLVFRTGPWRGDVRQFILEREPATKAIYVEDLYGTDDKSPLSVYLIDDVKTKGR